MTQETLLQMYTQFHRSLKMLDNNAFQDNNTFMADKYVFKGKKHWQQAEFSTKIGIF